VRQFRYRTPALTGPWRQTHDEAVRDAVKAKQAANDDDLPSGFRWVVPGQIEERVTAAEPARIKSS
jgi:hypothetical protein